MKRIKHIFLTAVLLLAMVVPSQAQIFIMDEDANLRPTNDGEAVLSNPQFGQGYDYYAPLGEGLMLLTVLGGAYLIGKTKMKENKQIK